MLHYNILSKANEIKCYRDHSNNFLSDDSIILMAYNVNNADVIALDANNNPTTICYNVDVNCNDGYVTFDKNQLLLYERKTKYSKQIICKFPIDTSKRLLFLFNNNEGYVVNDYLNLDEIFVFNEDDANV